MTDWAMKRFWSATEVAATEGGWQVLLDKRGIKTPGKSSLLLPTQALADAIAAEWEAQDEAVDPNTMPLTRSANSAIDKVRVQRQEIISLLAAYGESDLLCYRAEDPAALRARQDAAWDPYLAWAATELKAPLSVTTGILPIDQPAESVTVFHSELSQLSDFALTAAHDLIQLTGSAVLGLAALRSDRRPEQIWEVSRIDEAWQIEQWGEDEEAERAAGEKRTAFLTAARFYCLAVS